ncbi:cytochrome-c oxidase, cbb3-type subunit III [Tepidimonas taiwanensis]|uniref:Cbb3-type cytochrome c oxidase subunit n=1 Tax=Tepidimonas taiwanensis TaxID=307486 RepID=A0A554X5U8_9BURK|nr:cytochrome-c oxidase, cbb3-type subunit III [Tepidimonas taiwanensis]MCX7692962.1 cytochrome-c oxidase, cbb3-type subunit III [Tepidimonas taiwanensis]TSE31209.1 Cbb3-type cytochrome c oxidase subunit CcoP [Tepidimonas taiwanensis]UBQ04710.1 cytochrome-c oxidase, cbb3-type subunit III [Tepidimonas taiwanensis]
MSDFTSDFWHLYVAGITFISILACAFFLWASGKTKVVAAADNTTGHVWDGDLREMNNPLPRWWVYLFIITVVFALVYGAMYPMFGKVQGQLGWSSHGQWAAERAKALSAVEPLYAKFQGMDPKDLAKDQQAMAVGERLYMNYCAQCHGSDARGSKGFPNLTDADWLGGDGQPAYIHQTIAQGRQGIMPPMAAAVGTAEDVRNLAHYVLSLSGSPHDSVRATQGAAKFAACAACHGADGKGMHATGAPNLTDQVWLHGWGEEAIVRAIEKGFNNVMPAQNALLTDAQIHVLTAYVWKLSNPN